MSRFLELAMMVCFGVSWPFSVYRSYKARSAAGKSLVFLLCIFIGYIAGLLNKIIYDPSYVIAVYALNMLMVGMDLILYFRNRKLDLRKGNC